MSTSTVSIGVACNDDNGNDTGRATTFYFSLPCTADGLIHIAIDLTFRHLKPQQAVRIGRRKWPILSYGTWAGNMAWDSFNVTPVHAAEIANYLHERGGQVEAGWETLFDKWEAGTPLDEADFDFDELVLEEAMVGDAFDDEDLEEPDDFELYGDEMWDED